MKRGGKGKGGERRAVGPGPTSKAREERRGGRKGPLALTTL